MIDGRRTMRREEWGEDAGRERGENEEENEEGSRKLAERNCPGGAPCETLVWKPLGSCATCNPDRSPRLPVWTRRTHPEQSRNRPPSTNHP